MVMYVIKYEDDWNHLDLIFQNNNRIVHIVQFLLPYRVEEIYALGTRN